MRNIASGTSSVERLEDDLDVYFNRWRLPIREGAEVSAGPSQKIVRLRANRGFRVYLQNARERRRNLDLLGAVNHVVRHV